MPPPTEPMMLGVYDGYLPLAHDALSSLTKCGGNAVLHPAVTKPTPGSAEAKAAADAATSQLASWTTCGVCQSKMFLLLQAFAPLPNTRDETHNRVLYVFGCNSASCSTKPSDSWVAVSVQVNREDEDAAAAEEDEDDDEEPIPVGPTPSEFLPNRTSFPPIAVDIVPEPSKETIVPTDVERRIIEETEAHESAGDASPEDVNDLEAHIDLKNKPIDVSYDKFRRRVARCPRQVLRYQRGGAALFMNPLKSSELSVPPCEHCGGARAMELQLLPTLLYFVHAKEYVAEGKPSGDDGLDFATATIFSCAKGCLSTLASSNHGSNSSISHVHLQKEFLFVEPAPTVTEEMGGKPDLRGYFSTEAVNAAAAASEPETD